MDFGASLVKTVSQVVTENSEMPQKSVVEMMRMPMQKYENPTILEFGDTNESYESQQINNYKESAGFVCNGTPADLIVQPTLNTQIFKAVGSATLENTVPQIVGVPGATEKDTNPPSFDRYIQLQELRESTMYYGQTVPVMTAISVVSAVVIYVLLNRSNRRFSTEQFLKVL
jgi:hypothetical protein